MLMEANKVKEEEGPLMEAILIIITGYLQGE
jgi:hypothetical protein